MTPDEFLNLARRLSTAKGEAELRTAISRAYYAAFHLVHGFVNSCGVVLARDAAAHKHVAHCLQHSNDPELVAAGRMLDSLRADRNAADYRIDEQRFRDPELVQFCLGAAEEISTAVRAARQKIGNVRAAIRKHARHIMKLQVRGKD